MYSVVKTTIIWFNVQEIRNYRFKSIMPACIIVCYTAVFSVVTQSSSPQGALRNDISTLFMFRYYIPRFSFYCYY